ncbi:adenylate/guanylate cyclase domain-containing protein [Myxococcota bacterium]|nr:adenylate/guanylate cyclase domain-containing protein [Myxococcota bacterium]
MIEGFTLPEVLGAEGAARLEPLLDTLGEADAEALCADPEGQAEAIRELTRLTRSLLDSFGDLSLIHETVVEHATEMENELSVQNERITALTENMRRYLSPQLYARISGGEVRATSQQNRRRRITVFFSDIVGFTDMTDTVEPEVLSEVLNRYLEAMVEIATRWGATIDKFIGDAVMVFFGDDDETDPAEGAYRCVGMALEMQADVGRLLDAMSLGADRRLLTRMGINTGVCTVGNFGSVTHRMSYTAIGGAVNIASRLEGAAPHGGILISGATYHLIADRIVAEPRGALKLKGVSHPVETYEVLGLAGDKLAGRTTLTEVEGGFRLAPLELVPGVTSGVERREMALALRAALRLLERS